MKTIYMSPEEIDRYTREHIYRGDDVDGIPSFLMPDDTYVNALPKKKIMSKKLNEWIEQQPEDFCTEEQLRNYKRNEQLVSLWMIPEEYQNRVIEEYNNQANKGRSKMFNYFITKKLKLLMQDINSF